MRLLLKALLAATALLPAAAVAAQEAQDPVGDRYDRGGRPERPSPPPRAERPAAPQAPAGGWNRPDDRDDGPRQVGQRRPDRGGDDRGARPDRGDRPRLDPGRGDGRGEWTPRPDRVRPDQVRPDQARPEEPRRDRQIDPRGIDDRRFDRRRYDDRGSWNQPRPRYDDRGNWDRQRDNGWRDDGRQENRRVWNRQWRDDGRYDWNRYRATNRGAYRLPRYYAPSNWSYGYRRFSVGATLSTVLFDDTYWIDDPYSYRLPEAYGPYRWVRYYDDALLVDVRYGRVVDVVYDIFW